MKKITLAVALTCAVAASAHATDMVERQLNYVAGVGFTYGGDKLATGTQSNNDLRAGKGLVFLGGADFHFTQEFSMQATVGVHIDAINASSGGTKTFTRYPVELLAYYQPTSNFRFGGGLRYAVNPQFTSGYSLDAKLAEVVEGEFMVAKHIGIKLRYVNEKFDRRHTSYYESKGVSANHFGVLTNFYF